ncbi:hypothetical protein [Chryseobacterium turcicum]|uniref:Initiator Rep protein domain-containing protein n=1 Tax=Chryseobacterium turcicum TaxID=2898076 RepID=A0A9Q3YW63_9FLAO|nr:hypothetical protein [Chryseobacterium turcicum]MCD1118211.1 hypothetical protein [Chryseobacterium turcicum]
MVSDQSRKIIKRSYDDIENAKLIRIGNQFADDFLFQDNKATAIPINALRIIFNIISILRNDQFMPKKQVRQLTLFDEEFETENNVFISMKIRNKKISEKRSSKQIVEAYEYLTKFRMGWYTSKNIAGKDIKTFGGLISLPTYEKRGYTSFLISSFWLKKLIVLTEYNHIIYELVYEIRNNKHILFAIWLLKVPEDGTILKLSTFNQKFGLNYKTSNDFCVKFLRPIRLSLDKLEDQLSFNYKYEGDMISIIPYLNKNDENKSLTEKTNDTRVINQRLRYFRRRYCLEGIDSTRFVYSYSNISKIRSEIDKAYIKFIENNRAKGIASNNIRGIYFLQELQKFLIEVYRESETGKRFPNAYPVIL